MVACLSLAAPTLARAGSVCKATWDRVQGYVGPCVAPCIFPRPLIRHPHRSTASQLYTEGQYLDLDSAGHLTSYFLRQNAFRAAVVAGLERLNSEAVNVPAAYRQWLRPQQQ